MFKPKESSQSEYEFVSIIELVPDDHFLRLIDKYINFSILLGKVRLNRLSKSDKMFYKFRKEKIEQKLRRLKRATWLRYFRLRGLKNASEQALLSASCLNIKKIATHLGQKKCVAIL